MPGLARRIIMSLENTDGTDLDGLLFGVPMAVVALLVVFSAAEALGPAWSAAPARARHTEVLRGNVPDEGTLDALTEKLRASPSARDHGAAAFLQVLRARELGLKSIRALPRLRAARRDQRRALALAPADPTGWTRLAVLELHLGRKDAAAAALAAALALEPRARHLAAVQADLGTVLGDRLSPAARAVLEDRKREAASHTP